MRISRILVFATVSVLSLGLAQARVDVNRTVHLEDDYLSQSSEAQAPSLLERLKDLILPDSLASERPVRRVIAKAQCYGAPTVSVATCNGFGNVEENLAAVRAAESLGISFDRLKALMSSGYSLDSALRKLRPGADYSTELRRAREQARKDLSRLSL